MGLINTIGRAGVVTYGTKATFTFDIQNVTEYYASVTGSITQGSYSNSPTAGDITIDGETVTFAAGDLINLSTIAAKIVSTGVSGWDIVQNPSKPNQIIMTSTTIGTTIDIPAYPTLDTASNIIFTNFIFVPGTDVPAATGDDIYIGGRTPVQITLSSTGGSPIVEFSNGTLTEQKLGTLTYATLTLSSGMATITAPINFVRVNTLASVTNANLYISR